MPRVIAYTFLALALATGAFSIAEASSNPTPSWWAETAERALRDGYSLLNTTELADLMQHETPAPLLIDVRPDYEFKDGAIPGARNLEFDLSDRNGVSKKRKQQFLSLAGENKQRLLVIYCRSFR